MPRPHVLPDPALPAVSGLFAAQLRHQIGLLVRTPRAIGSGVVLPVLLVLLAGTSRGDLPASRVAGFATVGLTMITWTTHGIGLVAARETGVLKRWRGTPLPAWCHLAGRIGASVLVAVLAGAVTVVSAVALFGTHFDVPQAATIVAALAVGAITCATCSIAIAGCVPTVASAFPILGLSYLPLVLISGAFGPLSREPHWLTSLADYLPVQPVIDAVSHALGDSSMPIRDVLIPIAWTLAAAFAATATFRWQPSRPHRR